MTGKLDPPEVFLPLRHPPGEAQADFSIANLLLDEIQTKVALARLVGNSERTVTTEFLRLKSHFLFDNHFCLVRRPARKTMSNGYHISDGQGYQSPEMFEQDASSKSSATIFWILQVVSASD